MARTMAALFLIRIVGPLFLIRIPEVVSYTDINSKLVRRHDDKKYLGFGNGNKQSHLTVDVDAAGEATPSKISEKLVHESRASSEGEKINTTSTKQSPVDVVSLLSKNSFVPGEAIDHGQGGVVDHGQGGVVDHGQGGVVQDNADATEEEISEEKENQMREGEIDEPDDRDIQVKVTIHVDPNGKPHLTPQQGSDRMDKEGTGSGEADAAMGGGDGASTSDVHRDSVEMDATDMIGGNRKRGDGDYQGSFHESSKKKGTKPPGGSSSSPHLHPHAHNMQKGAGGGEAEEMNKMNHDPALDPQQSSEYGGGPGGAPPSSSDQTDNYGGAAPTAGNNHADINSGSSSDPSGTSSSTAGGAHASRAHMNNGPGDASSPRGSSHHHHAHHHPDHP